MRTLHHHPLYASSRTIRLMLAERGLVFMPKLESPWERHDDFLAMNPAGTVPVLVTEDGIVLAGAMVIAEFIEETEDNAGSLIWGGAAERAEIRRLTDWFETNDGNDDTGQFDHDNDGIEDVTDDDDDGDGILDELEQ